MDYYKNIDQIWDVTGLPTYQDSCRVSGLQVTFTSETNYVEPYDIDEFKEFAKIDFATDDALISLFLKSARIDVENHLQKSLGIRTINLTALKLPINYVLPFGPVNVVTTANFTNVGDILKEGGEDVSINYTTKATLVNNSIKQAIYKQAYHYYENRDKFAQQEYAGGLIDEVKMILRPYKNIQYP